MAVCITIGGYRSSPGSCFREEPRRLRLSASGSSQRHPPCIQLPTRREPSRNGVSLERHMPAVMNPSRQLERCISVIFSVMLMLLFQNRWFIIYRSSTFFFLSVENRLIFLHSTRRPRLCGEWMCELSRSFQWWCCVIVLSRVDVLCLFSSDSNVKKAQPRDWSGLRFRKFLASKWRWVAILSYLMVCHEVRHSL